MEASAITGPGTPFNVEELADEKVEAMDETKGEAAACSKSEAGAETFVREEEILNAELSQCIREIIEINKSILNDDASDKVVPVADKPDKPEEKSEEPQGEQSEEKVVDAQPQVVVAQPDAVVTLPESLIAHAGTAVAEPESVPEETVEPQICEPPPAKRRKIEEEEASASTSEVCTKPRTVAKPLSSATFWPMNWRNSLCKCTDCLQMYKEFRVEFITDLEDSVLFYQNKGLSKYEQESQQPLQIDDIPELNNLGHVGRIEVLMGYNKLRDKLSEFLGSFISDDRVITKDDVNGFFEKMKESDKDDRNRQA